MATLGAQSSVRSYFLQLINTAVSLILFAVLLGAGWIALSYLKSRISNHSQRTVVEPVVQNSVVTPLETPSAPAALVYQVLGDNTYYHTSAHLGSAKRRNAMSEQAALKRGLKPCPICMRP